jgi:NAD(P)-dependent dehydrogenase (short-subunit alcohol dehydrogenase family)
MTRTFVVTGAASGIGAATTRYLRERGGRVITCDLHDADVIADLTTSAGRTALFDGVARLAGGTIDAIVANAGGGPPETSLELNFFGTVATLAGLRRLLEKSPAPRAVAVSSIASLRPARTELVNACLEMDEATAVAIALKMIAAATSESETSDDRAEVGLDLYGSAKYALQCWCRRAAITSQWAGAGIPLNTVALGFYDTPAAAYIFADPDARSAMARMVPLRGAYPGRPEAAAALLAWCVSVENSQITGQLLFADGGFECAARP